ncbi:MAG TPA: hypothetical protein VLB76_02790 [Thermoanaerobaculia bacterium]|jgi:hypothetical protein|nr:hypothetical protein [Thermoanaerobaculia bacterium]
MKKQIKKLALSKETLRSLEDSGDLKKVAGATKRDTACAGCESGFYTCPSAAGGCASYLC